MNAIGVKYSTTSFDPTLLSEETLVKSSKIPLVTSSTGYFKHYIVSETWLKPNSWTSQ